MVQGESLRSGALGKWQRQLTIRSSRARFAASAWRRRLCHRRGRKSVRLNSGVSAQKKQISAKSFFEKRHKSFSDPLTPALRHISDLIHLRAVSDLLAPGNLSHPRHRANSQLQRANNSFKPTPLRSVVVTSSHPSAPASATLPQRRGLIQALAHRRSGSAQRASSSSPKPKPKSFSAPLSPGLRHISDLIRLRPVAHLLASSPNP